MAQFAIALGEATITEAAVERGFSAQGRILTALRNRLGQRACEAQVWLCLNQLKIANPTLAALREQKRQEKQVQKRKREEHKLNELLAKFQRK